MPKYRYTVINPDNKELTGSIATPDEKSAREELNRLGFSILKLETIGADAENEKTGTLAKFEFSATDKNGKKVVGTIQAEDRYGAYKRLVQEYLFQIEYLVDASLDEKSKQDQRIKGVFELQNRLDDEQIAHQKTEAKNQFDLEEFRQQQEILQDQVTFVLEKVESLLNEYESEIKPETKEKIRLQVDKILRIKNSTNLDYIRKSCEELLKFLQEEEIFLHQEAKQKEFAKLNLEAKSILMQLHEHHAPARLSLREKLENWRREHILENQDPSMIEYFLNFWISFLIGFQEDTEEIKALRKNITAVETSLKQYLILYFQANESNLKAEISQNIKNIWRNRRQLKRALRDTEKARKLAFKNRGETNFFEKFSNELLSFSGWLLTFYLLYYFVSILLSTKKISLPFLPETISVYKSIFLKYILSVLFLFYSALSIKKNFFRRNEIATAIITPLFLIGSALIIFNF